MVIYYATLKLAELVPRLFLLLSKNLVALDIYLGKRRTIEPLLTMLFIANFSNGFSGTKQQSSRSFRKCTYLFSACVTSFTHKVQQIRDTYFFSFKTICYEQVLSHAQSSHTISDVTAMLRQFIQIAIKLMFTTNFQLFCTFIKFKAYTAKVLICLLLQKVLKILFLNDGPLLLETIDEKIAFTVVVFLQQKFSSQKLMILTKQLPLNSSIVLLGQRVFLKQWDS